MQVEWVRFGKETVDVVAKRQFQAKSDARRGRRQRRTVDKQTVGDWRQRRVH